jgi:hypothetical protein
MKRDSDMGKAMGKKMDKVHKVMHEFKEKTLLSGSGKKVKDRKQAIAIALSEAKKTDRIAVLYFYTRNIEFLL